MLPVGLGRDDEGRRFVRGPHVAVTHLRLPLQRFALSVTQSVKAWRDGGGVENLRAVRVEQREPWDASLSV
jgi:hypothetical protein